MSDEKSRYLDARPVHQRLVVVGVLELTSPAHIGGNDPFNLSDSPVLRDAEGKPFIPGTTLTGLLRSYINVLLGIDRQKERPEIVTLFGCRWGEDGDDHQSSLIVDDAPLINELPLTEMRDGVKIDQRTGTAENKKKFDMEYLPSGTCFHVSFELLLDGGSDDIRRLQLFFSALQGLENGEISVGARRSRGHGRCKGGDWRYEVFDVHQPSGMLQWLGCQGGVPENWVTLEEQTADTIVEMMETFNHYSVTLLEPVDVNQMIIKLSLSCQGSLLIRSDGYDSDEADTVHLHRIQQGTDNRLPVLSGTSLGGVLRNRAIKIVNTLTGDSDNAEGQNFVENLFGTDMNSGKDPVASRVWTEEAVLEGDPARLRHVRVRIDRWRGSAVEHMLFDADALFGSTVDVSWKVFEPSAPEIGLMLCLVKDLYTGDLPVGGESSIGRGIFSGSNGVITIEQGGNFSEILITGEGEKMSVAEKESKYAENFMTALNLFLCQREVA